MPDEVTTAEVMRKLALALKSIKEELQLWHTESKQNQTAIAALNKRLDMLSQKTTVSPDVQREFASIKMKLQEISSKPAGPGITETKVALEAELSKLKQDIEQITSLQTRVSQLSTSSDMGDRQIRDELKKLKSEVEALPRETPSTKKDSEEFLSVLQKELEDWHKESMQNTKEITQLLKKINTIETKTEASDKVKIDLKRVITQIDQIADSATKFEELKTTIIKHNEEFKEVYSTIGKERVELDSLNESVTELQSSLVSWGQRNKESMEEVSSIRTELAALTKELKSKDMTHDVHDISDRMGELVSRVEALQQQERQLEELQQQLVDFDENLKELVRKAVMATISKQEFEAELDRIETKSKARTPVKKSTPPKKLLPPKKATSPPKKLTKEPTVPDMRAKMRQLREALKKETPDESLLDAYAAFEKEINSADSEDQKNLLWDNIARDVSESVKASIENAKKKMGTQKAAGEDTSRLNLFVAKADIGLVSFETAAAMRNLAKVKEVVQKLGELKSQIDSET